MDILQSTRKDDIELLSFLAEVKKDLLYMEAEEESQRSWAIPAGLPRDYVLSAVKKENPKMLSFTVEHEKLDNGLSKYTLKVFDPRPRDRYKYGA